MKSEKISIFNYEAFYLDHLEGTLGEEDTALLLDFLEEHPELMVEEDDFVMLDPKKDEVIFSDKESLKMISDDATIALSNAEHFLIAEAEGQLSNAKQEELNAFISQHPHLEKERSYFATTFLKADDSVVFSDSDSLKRMNDAVAIGLSNVEHFLIADAEGQLSPSKQKELNAFVSQHPHLEKERKYFAAMFLKADESIVYANKSGLKRKAAIIFWPYVALAAASVLIAFFFVMNDTPDDPGLAKKDPIEKKENPQQESPSNEPANLQLAEDVDPNNSVDDQNTSTQKEQGLDRSTNPNQQRNVLRNSNPAQPKIASVNKLKYQKPRGLVNSIDNKQLQPVASTINSQAASILPEDDMARVENTEMKNPIKPITSRLEKTLNRSVDFQTGKAADNSGGGFFLKIGKLEISRKKGKKKAQ